MHGQPCDNVRVPSLTTGCFPKAQCGAKVFEDYGKSFFLRLLSMTQKRRHKRQKEKGRNSMVTLSTYSKRQASLRLISKSQAHSQDSLS